IRLVFSSGIQFLEFSRRRAGVGGIRSGWRARGDPGGDRVKMRCSAPGPGRCRARLLHSGISDGDAVMRTGFDAGRGGGPRCRGTGCWRPVVWRGGAVLGGGVAAGGVPGLSVLAGRYAAGLARAGRSWPVQVEARLSGLGEVDGVSILPLVERLTPGGGAWAGEPGGPSLVRAGGMP